MKTAKHGMVWTLWQLSLLTVEADTFAPTKMRIATVVDADTLYAFARTTCHLQLNQMPFPRDYQDYIGTII